ncbi:MAG: glycosyltransferase [Sphingomonadales bacterium]|nr:glycosyltransferase [Sphingomonadales bacterium]
MRAPRVLSLATLFPSPPRPAFGGFVARQAEALAAGGEIDLITVNPIGLPPWPLCRRAPYRELAACPASSRSGPLTVHHPRFCLLPLIGGAGNPARIARAVLPLARRFHAEARFALVDAQFFFPDGPAAMQLAQALGVPLTIKARGSDIHYWRTRPGALAQMRAAAQRAAGLLAVSEALKRDMIALGFPAEKIRVHYTGLDHARFKVTPRAGARARMANRGLPADAPLIVCPGALIAIKGQRLAIEALAQLPGVHLALAGSGGDFRALQQLAAARGLDDRVHFLGQVSHDVLPTLLCAADAVVLPSEREGLANVWIEALACGTPLVIPDIGGAREVVTAREAGRIVAREPAAIAAALRELLANPVDQADVAAQAARFTWTRNAGELADFWKVAARA